MRIVSGRHRIAENHFQTKHVVAAGGSAWDAGSTPAASTIFIREQFKARMALLKNVFPNGLMPPWAGTDTGLIVRLMVTVPERANGPRSRGISIR